MPILNPLSRKYAALVVNIRDPRRMGRVRVRIDGLHDDVEDEFLPWAIPAEMSQGHGSLDLPTVGHRILVQMQDREGSELLYFGNIINPRIRDMQRVPDALQENYPHRAGMWDRYGNYMYRDQKDGKMVMATANGVTLEQASNGKVTLNITGSGSPQSQHDQTDSPGTQSLAGELEINVTGNITIKSDANIRMEAVGNINVVGANVYWD